MPGHLVATPAAAALLRRLVAEHGPLLLHHSAGCCEGSAPICLRQKDFRVGASDRLLGSIEGCPVYAGTAMADVLKPYDITLDVTEGAVDSFSLEAPDGVRFTVLSRPRSG